MIVDDFPGPSRQSHQKKKKKKRSFLQKLKCFSKRGSYGLGTPLSPDMYEYFLNIVKVMSKKEDEEMCILASNVLTELEGKEAVYCGNQIVSRVVENLLPFSSDEEFAKFLEKFSENLRPLFSDVFGSHVLQQTIMVAYTKYEKLATEVDNKLRIKFYDYILKVSNFSLNNLEEFIWNTYGNAVVRTVFNVLSGNPVKGEVKLSPGNQHHEITSTDEFKSIIRKYVKRILSWPHFNDLCNQSINSSLLQGLLLASRSCDEHVEFIGRIIAFYEVTPLDLTSEENIPFARLLEVVLCVSDKCNYKKIYKLIFEKRLTELAMSKSGNFAVQKLLMNCQSIKIFEKIFFELESDMENILKVGHSGVLLALVKGCRRLGVNQGDCMKMLMRVFQVKGTGELVPLICRLNPGEIIDSDIQTVNLHGSLVVQELLHFKKPIAVVNSLLELPESKLVKLLSDVRGSHITNEFVTSSTIGEKSRDKLFKKLTGHYLELAKSKFGSRTMDALWSVLSVQQKTLLAEELKAKQSELCSDVYGKGFERKIYLSNFRRNKSEWMKLQKAAETAEKYFADVILPKKRKKNQ